MAVRQVSDGGVLRSVGSRALSRQRLDRVRGQVRFALELVAPTSIVVAGSGSSASVVGLGSVDFASATSLSLNGVFSAEYDNYMISIRHLGTSTTSSLDARLRVSSVDAQTNYTYQYLIAQSTNVTGARSTYGYAVIGNASSTQRSGDTVFVYGPYLAQPTAFRNVSAGGRDNAYIGDWACTHSTASSYDGITLFAATSSTLSGNVAVYGLRG